MKRKEGFILIQCVLSLFILVSFLVFFAGRVNQYRMKVHGEMEENRKKIEARSCVCQIIDEVAREGEKNADWTRLQALGKNLPFEFQLEDESGKLNLNQLVSSDETLRGQYQKWIEKLFEKLHLSPFLRQGILEFVKSKGPFQTLNQIPILERAQKESHLNLARYLTVHSEGRVNVNTAPKEVLEVLLEEGEPFLVKEILSRRQKRPLSEEEIRSLSRDVSSFLAVRSTSFHVIIRDLSEGKARLSVMVERSLGEMKIREWVEQ
ncbi:MAG: general secretion pathway protein GspK [Chlamydiae bacterium]|nr:general secretion pathway protein GspK [Chlamydiota bacterium]MBI3266085.1 general secretion pathway protein GspK [Chlamydiota bacterium]